MKSIRRLLKSRRKENFSVSYGGHANLYRDGSAALDIMFKSDAKVTVKDLFLAAGVKRLHASNWKPISFSGTRGEIHRFNLSEILDSSGEMALEKLKLIATTNSNEYESPIFNLLSLIR